MARQERSVQQAQQAELSQQQQQQAIVLMQQPSFPRSGDQRNDFQRAMHAVQEHHKQEWQETYRQISEFETQKRKYPAFEKYRSKMAGFLQSGHAEELNGPTSLRGLLMSNPLSPGRSVFGARR